MAFDVAQHARIAQTKIVFHQVIPIFRPTRMIGGVDDLDFLQCSALAFLAEGYYVYSDFEQYRLHLMVFPDTGSSSAP